MKPSHTQTPRNLADCTFTVGYDAIDPMSPETPIERIAGYAVAFLIGTGLALLLVAWWSS
ncbi:MAG: hypothetical protein RL442_46 [Pseudomonadota bacterium]|jgi:hypothetical protein